MYRQDVSLVDQNVGQGLVGPELLAGFAGWTSVGAFLLTAAESQRDVWARPAC